MATKRAHKQHPATPGQPPADPAAERCVVVVGLGPGGWADLTLAARDLLMRAPRVLARTLRHPTIEALREQRPDLALESFDALYDEAESFATLYPAMVERLLTLADEQSPGEPLIYAVPGHPLLGEESVRRLRAEAPARGVAVHIVPGLSYLEPVCAALGLDPMERDLQLVDGTLLAQTPAAALMGALLPTRPALIAQVYNRRVAGEVKLALAELYPEDWEVALVHWAGLPAEEVTRLPLYALDRDERADHLTTLYIPPLEPVQAVRVPEGLRAVVAQLRAPNGCPWDREQTHWSLRKYVLEEAYEVAEVLDEWQAAQGDGASGAAAGADEFAEHLAEELGDLLLQVYLQAEIADEEGYFSLADIYQSITTKLIRRHPHVFGDVTVRDAEHVVRNWEAIKRQERAAKGEEPRVESALRGVPKSAPALYQAYELGRKAAKVGFDWPDSRGVLENVAEEARELVEAAQQDSRDAVEHELGDLFFVLTRLADRLHIQPEDALLRANARFRRRFAAMEEQAQAEGHDLTSVTPAQWLAWWAEAKRREQAGV